MILAWVTRLACVRKILTWIKKRNDVDQKNVMSLNVFLFNHALYTESSIKYDLIIPTEFNKLYSSSLSYLVIDMP